MSYQLYIEEKPSSGSEVKPYVAGREIPASRSLSEQWYVTGPLLCGSTYLLSLAAINDGGESEAREEEFTMVCSAPSDSHNLPPFIIFTIGPNLYSKDITIGPGMWEQPALLAQTEHHINSMDFHLRRETIFLVTTESVLVGNILQNRETNIISVPAQSLLTVDTGRIKKRDSDLIIDVSVDWLADRVYFSLESPSYSGGSVVQQYWYFVFCHLNVTKCQNLNLSLAERPHHLRADPYHGYLYWLERLETDQIFRTDLSAPSSCPGPGEKELLYSGEALGPFVVSFSQYSLLVPDLHNNKMLEVSLDLAQPPRTIHNNYKTILNSS